MRRALELGAAYVLVLNNDVEVDPVFVCALVEEARPSPRRRRALHARSSTPIRPT